MWQILTIVVLLGIMIGMQQLSSAVPTGPFDPKSLAATGFIVLAAFTMGELMKRFKLPALLGYILAGIFFGPNLAKLVLGQDATALFDQGVIDDLALINVLTIGVIGTLGGGELKLADVKENGKSLLLFIGLLIFGGIPFMAVLLTIALNVPFDLIGFLKDEPRNSQIAAIMLFAIIAMAMSPSASLPIIQETRSRGKFTSLVLGTVVMADLTIVALMLVGISVAGLLLSPEGISTGAVVALLPAIIQEFGFALLIGIVTGVIFIIYMRYVEREMMLFTIAIIFAASYVCKIMHAETLLAFLTAGFVVQNTSRYGHKLIHELETISLPVFIVYFMTQAAQLRLEAVFTALPITLLIASGRASAYFVASRFAAKVTNRGELTRRYWWVSCLSIGGVDLVLAAMVAARIPQWGAEYQTVVMAMVVVHIIAGPPLLKYALGQMGETEEARKRTSAVPATGVSGLEAPLDGGRFAQPNFPDPYLNGRLGELRDDVMALHQRLIAAPTEKRRATLVEALAQTQRELDAALTRLAEALQGASGRDDEATRRTIAQLHVQHRRKLQPLIDTWERLEPLPLTAARAQQLLDAIRGMEEFESHYIVDMEPNLFNIVAAQARFQRLMRSARRLQRSVGVAMRRTVPLGRLWRYYMELSVPSHLAAASVQAGEHHQAFWRELGAELRRADALFAMVDRLLRGESIELPAPPAPHEQEEGHGHTEGHEQEGEAAMPTLLAQLSELDVQEPPRERALGLVRLEVKRRAAIAGELTASLTDALERATQGYTWGLQRAFEAFLRAVEGAGTMELPTFKYRPSTRYHEALRAEEQLRQALRREHEVVAGQIGWIVVDHQLVLFRAWSELYQTRIADTLQGHFHKQILKHLERLQSVLAQAPAPGEGDPVDWQAWLKREVVPASLAVRRALDRALVAFSQGVTSRRLIDALEYRVARISEEVNLLVQGPEVTTGHELSRVLLRQWFSHRLVNEIALQYIDFSERVEHAVRRGLVGLEDLEQVLEYNLDAAQRAYADEGQGPELSAQLATTALERGAHLVEQLAQSLAQDAQEIERWIGQEVASQVQRAVSPFATYKLSELQQERYAPASAERAQGLVARALQPARALGSRAYRALAPLFEEVIEDVRNILSAEQRPQQRALLRERLGADQADPFEQLPPIYRRLFNPVPLDLPEFYVARPTIERACLEAIAGWGEGRDTSILIFGDRGVGKRTFIHYLAPIRVYDLSATFQDVPILTLRLSDEVEDEEGLCQQLWPLFENGAQPRSFATVLRLLQEQELRRIVIIENANKCYQRSEPGMQRCRDFLEMIGASSKKVLWILLMETPAVTYLDTMIDLFDFVTHAFELGPFDEDQLEQMILKRHRVSGFEVDFELPHWRLLERTRHPFTSSESLRQPRGEYFRRLRQRSHGNPLLALLDWLSVVALIPGDETRLLVRQPEVTPFLLMDTLTLKKRLMLAALLQHGSLTAPQLAALLCDAPREVQTELDHLLRLGLIEPLMGTAHHYQVRPLAAPRATWELRRQNLV